MSTHVQPKMQARSREARLLLRMQKLCPHGVKMTPETQRLQFVMCLRFDAVLQDLVPAVRSRHTFSTDAQQCVAGLPTLLLGQSCTQWC